MRRGRAAGNGNLVGLVGHFGALEGQFDAAAQFASDIVLAIENGADLQADYGAVKSQRFDSQDARAIDQRGGPIRVVAKFRRDFIQDRNRLAYQFVGANGDVHESLRPIPAEIRNLANQAVGNGDDRSGVVAQNSAAQGEMFDATGLAVHLQNVAEGILILEDDEKSIDEVFKEVLRAEGQ